MMRKCIIGRQAKCRWQASIVSPKRFYLVFDDINFDLCECSNFRAYGQSKTRSALLAVKALAQFEPKGASAFKVHPGKIETELGRYIGGDDVRANTDRSMGKEKAAKWFAHFKDVPQGGLLRFLPQPIRHCGGKRPI